MIVADAAEQGFDIGVDGVVAPDRDPSAAAVRDLPRGVVDRARHVIRGRPAADASAGHVDRGARSAELERDSSARPAAPAGDQGDDVVQLCHAIDRLPASVQAAAAGRRRMLTRPPQLQRPRSTTD
jgi:hypothetical protein